MLSSYFCVTVGITYKPAHSYFKPVSKCLNTEKELGKEKKKKSCMRKCLGLSSDICILIFFKKTKPCLNPIVCRNTRGYET